MLISITPVSKPRQTQADKWLERPVVMRYRAFADKLREEYHGDFPTSVSLVFSLPMPASWSTKKKDLHRHQPHQQKPDIDNLVKAVLDALLKDDSAVWRLDASKVWADTGSILIESYDV